MDDQTQQQYRRIALSGLVLLLLFLGALLRFDGLARRPMHTDEAVHAVKLGTLLASGDYRYDPTDYHGPTLYYFTLPVLWFHGVHALKDMDAGMLRVVPAVFGLAVIALALGFARGIGWRAALYAGLLTAVSPAFVFYSRYYIQEQLFVAFTLAALVAGWRYAQTRAWGWALATGVCLGLMHATKETAILAWGAMAGGLLLTFVWSRLRDAAPLKVRSAVSGRDVMIALVAGLLLSAALISGGFRHPRGVVDSWLTYAAYLGRSSGVGLHDHPWYYYLKMLLYTHNAPGPWWSEALIVGLAVVGVGFALSTRASAETSERTAQSIHLIRFLAFYTLLLTVLYSVIPYKTPWCVLGFLNGMVLMAGVGADRLVRLLPGRVLRTGGLVLVAVGVVHLANEARRATSARFDADTRNPYVYAQATRDVARLGKRVEALAACDTEGDGMVVKVMAKAYWPLPWYLRGLRHVGYWNTIPTDPVAPVMIVSPDLAPALEARLARPYHTEYYGLRPEVLVRLYVDQELWERFLDERVKN